MSAALEKVAEPAYPSSMVDRDTIRGARGMLGWSAEKLASESGVSLGAIKDIERGATDPKSSTLEAIRAAFDRAGVVLLSPGDMRPGGKGLRFR